MTFFRTKPPALSIFALCVNSARDHHAYFTIEVRHPLVFLGINKKFSLPRSSVV